MVSVNDRIAEPTPANLGLYAVYALLTSWASMYVWANHTSHLYLLAAVLLAIFLGPIGYALFVRCPGALRGLLASRAFWCTCIVAISAADVLRFGAHAHDPHPSTAAPALRLPAEELVHGRDPYRAHLDDGAAISPGPGWILLLAPLTLPGGTALLTGIALAGCVYLVARRSALAAGLVTALVLLQPVLVTISFSGHDIFVIPIFFAILCLLAEEWVDSTVKLIAVAVLAAAFATSRIPMVALLLILCLGLFRLRRRAGVIFSAVALPLTLILHGVFFLWTREDHIVYQPLHLFSRGSIGAGHTLELIGLAAASLVALVLLVRMTGQAREWIAFGGVFLAAAFVPVGLGELLFLHVKYQVWEGSNYVSFGASLLAIALALRIPRKAAA